MEVSKRYLLDADRFEFDVVFDKVTAQRAEEQGYRGGALLPVDDVEPLAAASRFCFPCVENRPDEVRASRAAGAQGVVVERVALAFGPSVDALVHGDHKLGLAGADEVEKALLVGDHGGLPTGTRRRRSCRDVSSPLLPGSLPAWSPGGIRGF